MSYRIDNYVDFWDAINAVVVASGGSAANTSVARQKAVIRVEKALADLCKASREPLVAEVIAAYLSLEPSWRTVSGDGKSLLECLRRLAEWKP